MIYLILNSYRKHWFQFSMITFSAGKLVLSILLVVLLHNLAFSQTIRVACAANMLSPIEQIAVDYAATYKQKVEVIPGASGALATQILNGAPFDIYISANENFADQLFENGVCLQPEILVNGTASIWSKKAIPSADVARYLTSNKNIMMAIASPDLAPFGKLAQKWLQEQGLWPIWEHEIIYGQSINQINHFIATGSVDVAFTSNSAQFATSISDGFWYNLTGDDYVIPQTYCVVNNQNEIPGFIQYLKSEAALKRFASFGYQAVKNE